MLSGYQQKDDRTLSPQGPVPDPSPIEPRGTTLTKFNWLKWIVFLVFILYVGLSYYYPPILTRLGQYLVLSHPPQESDLIVCLSGENVERGLSAADAYRKGLAPRILLTREQLPDGYALLKERGIEYPETIDLLVNMLTGLGVPRSALIIPEGPVDSTLEEAMRVKGLVAEKGFRSLILITSPTHTRRAWLTFTKVIQNKDVRILVIPSSYSKYRPQDWWKTRKYLREVIVEYEKLVYYYLKYFL